MNNELVQVGFFDLESDMPQKTWHIGLGDKLQDTLRQRAAKIKTVVAQANFIIGEELANAQKELTYKNGGFVKWLEEEVGIDHERAYEFIRIWEGYKMLALSANISGIGKKVLLKSSKDDVPESARQEIVTRHEAGEKITLATADEIVERHKAEIAKLQAEKERIQSQFDFYKQDAEQREDLLNARIDDLENAPQPEPVKVIEYQDTLETAAKVATLEQQIKALEAKPNISPEKQQELEKLQLNLKNAQTELDFYTKQNRALAEEVKKLGEESGRSYAESVALAGRLRIRQEWQYATGEVQAALRKFHTRVPSEIDRESFEGEEHTRTSQTIEILEHTILVLKQTLPRLDATLTIVDARIG